MCEQCAAPLPPDATNAMICTFECTFCADCVEQVLGNVCPNCGGGFCPRPNRPARDWKDGATVANFPPSSEPQHHPVDPVAHSRFAAAIRAVAPEDR